MQFKQQEHGYSDKYNITTLPPQAKRDRKVCPGCRCHPAQTAEVPFIYRPKYRMGFKTRLQKIKAIVESTWKTDVNSLSGVPSWMLVLIKAVLQKTGSEYLTDVWPNMEVFFHGGISFEPYRDQYKALIPSDRMHYMETYNASEGFFGLQDNPEEHLSRIHISEPTRP